MQSQLIVSFFHSPLLLVLLLPSLWQRGMGMANVRNASLTVEKILIPWLAGYAPKKHGAEIMNPRRMVFRNSYKTVSLRIRSRILLPHTGQNSHSVFAFIIAALHFLVIFIEIINEKANNK